MRQGSNSTRTPSYLVCEHRLFVTEGTLSTRITVPCELTSCPWIPPSNPRVNKTTRSAERIFMVVLSSVTLFPLESYEKPNWGLLEKMHFHFYMSHFLPRASHKDCLTKTRSHWLSARALISNESFEGSPSDNGVRSLVTVLASARWLSRVHLEPLSKM
jgi:hypothetical protein